MRHVKNTDWFQCSLETLYRVPNTRGRMTWQFSSIRLRMYSLFQKYRARSATWKRENGRSAWALHHTSLCSQTLTTDIRQTAVVITQWVWKKKLTWKWGLEMQAAICLKRGSCTRINWDGSITSRISSISPRNITWGWYTNTQKGTYTLFTEKISKCKKWWTL